MADLRTAPPDDPATWVLLDGLTPEEADDLVPPRGVLLVVVEGTETVAGGALTPLEDGVGQIKRMWTAPAHRGRGHGRRVLAALERQAFELGYRLLRLTTNAGSGHAQALYRSAGYQLAPPFDRYPLVLDFEKWLVSDDEGHIPMRTGFLARPDVAA
jgi:ribosomal protein S18 acetylase RimI-like enzyme